MLCTFRGYRNIELQRRRDESEWTHPLAWTYHSFTPSRLIFRGRMVPLWDWRRERERELSRMTGTYYTVWYHTYRSCCTVCRKAYSSAFDRIPRNRVIVFDDRWIVKQVHFYSGTLLHTIGLFLLGSPIPHHTSPHRTMSCQLEIKALDSRKVMLDAVSVEDTTVENVFRLIDQNVEPSGTPYKLLAVVNDRLRPLRWAEKERKLAAMGFQPDNTYRVEVCLAWSELKKVFL